ncbi:MULTISPECIES: hypothetical protein [unclassified Devosia]|uniref:hypothetical protein n=1 Tax=unclassified Devosia TaxID=196773 RepID=UPI00145FA5CE|nr:MULTISPECIES: hypothetical protein [unclassified Devosia]MBJ7578738.1 hypothetical protein [Devosia sp. MC532]
MTEYVQVSETRLPAGHAALLLFVQDGNLCAGTLTRRHDGRMERSVSPRPDPNDLMRVIVRLMGVKPVPETLYVVLERGAHWPEQFPKLRVH